MNIHKLLLSGFLWIGRKRTVVGHLLPTCICRKVWQHQQDWTTKSFSRLIIFPFRCCVLCISAQWCRYHRLLFSSFPSVFLFVVVVFFKLILLLYFLHHRDAVRWPIVNKQTVCVWDISNWFSGTLAWRIARQLICNLQPETEQSSLHSSFMFF